MLARDLKKMLENLDNDAKVMFVDAATGKELEVWEYMSTGMLTAFISLNTDALRKEIA